MSSNKVPPHRTTNPDFTPLQEMVRHHIESFDHMIDSGLQTMFNKIKPVEVFDPVSKKKLRIWAGDHEVFPPQKESGRNKTVSPLYPFECRQAKTSYDGKFKMDVWFQYDHGAPIREQFNLGRFPIMLKSNKCTLRNADSKKLVSLKEEASESGGYFILNGLERVVRLLILQKRNYPMSLIRSSFRDRKEGYTDKAIVIRCVREDQSAVTVKLYYLSNGSARLGFWAQGKEYMLPVGLVLKALADTTDQEIYVNLTCSYNKKNERVKGSVGTQLVGERVKIILDEVRDLSLITHKHCLQHIGTIFVSN